MNGGIELPPDILRKNQKGWAVNFPLATNGGALFAVTAPWCGHCSALKKSVAEAQARRPFDFFYSDGDKSDKHRQQVQQMGIEGFPTLYGIAPGGLLVPYEGGRDPNSL